MGKKLYGQMKLAPRHSHHGSFDNRLGKRLLRGSGWSSGCNRLHGNRSKCSEYCCSYRCGTWRNHLQSVRALRLTANNYRGLGTSLASNRDQWYGNSYNPLECRSPDGWG